SPLLELRSGRGSYIISHLELFSKLAEAPGVAEIIGAIANYRAAKPSKTVGVCVTDATMDRLREGGYQGSNQDLPDALRCEIVVVDGDRLLSETAGQVKAALENGQTIYLHALGVDRTRHWLSALGLPGKVNAGTIHSRARSWTEKLGLPNENGGDLA